MGRFKSIKLQLNDITIKQMVAKEIVQRNNNNNNNNNNLYFTRVTQSNTRFDFRCGPQI